MENEKLKTSANELKNKLDIMDNESKLSLLIIMLHFHLTQEQKDMINDTINYMD